MVSRNQGLHVETLGQPAWPRYIVRDVLGRYWSGAAWTWSRRHGRLYNDPDHAETERDRLAAEYGTGRTSV